MLIWISIVASILGGLSARGADPPPQGHILPPADAIPAPVYYKDTMLILTTKKGVAAVAFDNPINLADREGIAYRYRFRSKDGHEETGKGEVYEGIGGPDDDAESLPFQVVIRAGNNQILWSRSNATKGYVYYSPEKMRVQIASSAIRKGPNLFKAVRPREPIVDPLTATDLSRFEW
jgi:hypothetical protein